MRLEQGTRRWLVRFSVTTVLTSAAVVAAAWFTPLRDVLHGALLTVAVVAFLPFVFALIGFALLSMAVCACAIGAMFGEAVDPTVGVDGAAAGCELSLAAAPGYYRWLAKRRHPVFWGLWAGCLVGAGLLSLILFCLVVPGESRTALCFAEAQGAIEEYRISTGVLPSPTERGHLELAGLDGLSEELRTAPVLLDGFGRPVLYSLEAATPTLFAIRGLEVSGGRGIRYRLTSLGFDGVQSRDDLRFAGPAFRVAGDGAAGLASKLMSKLTGEAAKQYLQQMAGRGGKLEPMIDALTQTESYRNLTKLLAAAKDASKPRRWATQMELILALREPVTSPTNKDDEPGQPISTP